MTDYVEVDDAARADSTEKFVEPEDFAHAVLRLAELERHEFDGVRKAEADKLNVRVSTLDGAVEKIWRSAEAKVRPGNGQDLKLPEPEPWPEAV